LADKRIIRQCFIVGGINMHQTKKPFKFVFLMTIRTGKTFIFLYV